MRAALIVALALVAARVAAATPSQELEHARAEFRAGHFTIAQPLFNDLLYPPPPKLASADDLTEAYTNLGICRAATGDVEGAKREFEKALQIDPNHQIDPTVVTDKAVIRLFDDTKADIKNRAERLAAQNAKLQYEQQLVALRKNIRLIEAHPAYLIYFPFGIGQLSNDQVAKAIGFGSAQTVTFGLSIGIWAYLADKYGISCKNCVAPTDASTVRLLQQTEIVSGVAFFGLYVWSMIDAYRNYTPTTTLKVDDEFLKHELDKATGKPKKTSLHFAPIVTPNSVGIGLSWEH